MDFRIIPSLCLIGVCVLPSVLGGAEVSSTTSAATAPADRSDNAAMIDRFLPVQGGSASAEKTPADDGEFLRRVTLDLAGRIPTIAEQRAYAARPVGGRRSEVIDRLLEGPEFPLHFARVIDDWVQRQRHGDEAFVEWLRAGLAAGRSWDSLFRAMLVGPWEAEADRPANRFLVQRAKDLDGLTADASRAFFGVDITCARCHDHPLVPDWTQDDYYGLASFFHRTQVANRNGGEIVEKSDGELSFEGRKGGRRTARPTFLDGRPASLEGPALPKKTSKDSPISRRQFLVDAALTERNLFGRAAVNRIWAWFFGRGLVEPVDQMHSGNPSSVPNLLETLAEDFSTHGYDLRRLVKQIVTSRAYQAAGPGAGRAESDPDPALFVASTLRPLTPRQFALSLVLAIDDADFSSSTGAERARRYRELEKRAAGLLPGLDPTVEGYQASFREALYLANHADFQQLVGVGGKNRENEKSTGLVARLLAASDDEARIVGAFEALLGRRPSTAEIQIVLKSWSPAGSPAVDRRESVCDLVWALATSAEFRFNH